MCYPKSDSSYDKFITDPAKSIKEYYEGNTFNKDCFRDKCNEKGVSLHGVTNRSYVILNGDEIKKCRGKEKHGENSADCILIKHIYEIDDEKCIYFAELTTKSHHFKKVKNKFQDSYNEIKKAFKEKDQDIFISKFVYIHGYVTKRELDLIKDIEINTTLNNKAIKRPIKCQPRHCDINQL
jgi:hypothetical protein